MNRVLYFGLPSAVTQTRRLLLERAGYTVEVVHTLGHVEDAAAAGLARVMIVGSAMDMARRTQAVRIAREHRVCVLSLHRGLRLPGEDVALDPFCDANEFLFAAGHLLMRSHHHREVRSRYFLFVDSERRYVHASQAVCSLLGYERRDLLGMRIEDLTYPGSADAATLFARYLRDGSQVGAYTLRHRSGRPVRMNYRARVLPDGCMVSEFRPMKRQPASR